MIKYGYHNYIFLYIEFFLPKNVGVNLVRSDPGCSSRDRIQFFLRSDSDPVFLAFSEVRIRIRCLLESKSGQLHLDPQPWPGGSKGSFRQKNSFVMLLLEFSTSNAIVTLK